jgi:hypothetical protein
MSTNDAANPDPSVVPQVPPETKGDVEPVKPGQSPALSKVPTEVKTTISKADETLIRISKYVID